MIPIGSKPQKGKSYENLPQKAIDTFDRDLWLTTIKYDGNQIFIQKEAGVVRMFTSDWKEFILPSLKKLLETPKEGTKEDAEEATKEDNYTIVAEFMYDSEGKLGDRTKSAILTTLRTAFTKEIPSGIDETKVNIRVFDIINKELLGAPYSSRYGMISSVIMPLKDIYSISPVKSFGFLLGTAARQLAKQVIADGYEGLMLANPDAPYMVGKRVNHVVKLKGRLSADLLCIDYELAESGSQFDGLIGALVLRDSLGRVVSVGSGLTPEDRKKDPKDYLGKIIEIQYEQILETFIQPSFQCVRLDKTESD